MSRTLAFHHHGESGNEIRMLPAYYIEADYAKVAVRVNAEYAPTSDAKIDIFDDGVSIFNNNALTLTNVTTGKTTVGTVATTVSLIAGENSEVHAEDFNDTVIDKGSWVHCNLVNGGGGKNFTVLLELENLSEEDEPEE